MNHQQPLVPHGLLMPHGLLTWLRYALLVVLCIGAGSAAAQLPSALNPVSDLAGAAQPELLPAEQAFQVAARVRGDVLRVELRAEEGYYLYRDRITVASATPGTRVGNLLKPPGIYKDDPQFGRVQVYRGSTEVEVALIPAPAPGEQVRVNVTSQGCADIGLCYPPQTTTLDVDVPAGLTGTSPQGLGTLASLGASFGSTASLSGGSSAAGSATAATPAPLLGSSGDFLPVDEAFRVRAVDVGDGTLNVVFDIAAGYYLYRSRLGFDSSPPGRLTAPAVLPVGKTKVDDYFGEQEVYYDTLTARLPVSADGAGMLEVMVSYQGCADAGLCYPPQTRSLPVALTGAGSGAPPAAGALVAADGIDGSTAVLSETDRLAVSLVNDSLLWVLGTFFLAGILLAFTPCVLPMIPILSAIIAGQRGPTTGRRGFALAAVYVLAMSLTYTLAGVAAGLFGQNLQALFQHPAVLIGFSALFVALSLSMFGFYDLQLPAAMQARLTALSQRQRGGSYYGVSAMGVLSALIVGPCVAAPLAAALIVIGSTGDPVRGGLALFSLSLGMGVPLLAVGAFGPRLLPRAGAWMNLVKSFFGIMLLAVAVYLLSRMLSDAVTLTLWAALALLTAGVLFRGIRPDGSRPRAGLRMAAAAGAATYAAVLAVGAATGAHDPLRPLAALGQDAQREMVFQRIKTVADLERVVAEAQVAGRDVMLDFYADWCVSCKEMEHETFSDRSVQAALGDTVLIQADVTDYDAADKALLARFGLHGPPAILFFGPDGTERREFRVIGFMNAAAFQPHVTSARRS